jgi:CRP/FNR family cyclic AMP-dependent transcriptional regulator
MKTILLIEDNADVRMVMTEVLEGANYKAVIAADGQEGIRQAIKEKPDVIVCDIMMPGMDGYEVIGQLQKNPETQGIPFIFMTALGDRNEVRKGMELGADDYITKPLLSGDELINAIEARLKKSEQLKQALEVGLDGLDNLMATATGQDPLNTLTDKETAVYKKKQPIYLEGELPSYLYFIKVGKVKVFKTNDDGKELVTAIYTSGEFIGYTAIIEDGAYRESAEAMDECVIAKVPARHFKGLLNTNIEVVQKFVQLLASNVSEREKQLLELAYSSLRKKVSSALISIYRKFKGDGQEAGAIKINRENLANFTGTAKESVIRTLSDFKDEKLIDIREGHIVILNEEKLVGMLN